MDPVILLLGLGIIAVAVAVISGKLRVSYEKKPAASSLGDRLTAAFLTLPLMSLYSPYIQFMLIGVPFVPSYPKTTMMQLLGWTSFQRFIGLQALKIARATLRLCLPLLALFMGSGLLFIPLGFAEQGGATCTPIPSLVGLLFAFSLAMLVVIVPFPVLAFLFLELAALTGRTVRLRVPFLSKKDADCYGGSEKELQK